MSTGSEMRYGSIIAVSRYSDEDWRACVVVWLCGGRMGKVVVGVGTKRNQVSPGARGRRDLSWLGDAWRGDCRQ